MTAPNFLDVLEEIITFPRAALTALGEAGLLGLLSSPAVGGLGAT